MTDLIALDGILSSLQDRSQTKIDLYDANAALQALHDTYEADRTASAQEIDTLTQSKDHLALLLSEDANTIAQLNTLAANQSTQLSALSGTITSLQTQVVALTQFNASLDATNSTLVAQMASLSPDVTVTSGAQIATSNFSTAVSHVSTNDLMLGDATARARAEAALAPALSYHRVSCHSFGAGDPWLWNGTGTRPADPNNWGNLDGLVQMSQRMSKNTIMGFGNWPWHTRGRWDGTNTVPCTYADQLVTDGRPITEKLPDVLHFVECIVKRYAAAPYNIRHWQLGAWEFHGMDRGRDGTYNHWAYHAHPGSPGQADMGMAFLHDQVAAKIIATAASMNIPRDQIKIITNYPPMVTYGAANAFSMPVGSPLRGQPWGTLDKRSPEAVEAMLPLLNPTLWDVWSFDMGIYTKDGVIPVGATDWNVQAKFTDIPKYLMSRVAALGFGSKPLWISEVYPKPIFDPGPNSQQYRAAIAADAMRRMILEGVSLGIIWSTVGRANDPGVSADAGLHSSVATATGGQPQAMLDVVRLIHDHFGPSKIIYDLVASDTRVGGLATDSKIFLYNKTPNALKVALGNDMYTLAAYEVRVVAQN